MTDESNNHSLGQTDIPITPEPDANFNLSGFGIPGSGIHSLVESVIGTASDSVNVAGTEAKRIFSDALKLGSTALSRLIRSS